MAITYYKRFRMEIDLDGSLPAPLLLPTLSVGRVGMNLCSTHTPRSSSKASAMRSTRTFFLAWVKRTVACGLMREIRRKPGFLAVSTWLIASPEGYCGTVQGVMDRGPIGAIQNLGVVPAYRGLGSGSGAGSPGSRRAFTKLGLRQAYLEVTAENSSAVQLYRAIGFRRSKTLVQSGGWLTSQLSVAKWISPASH